MKRDVWRDGSAILVHQMDIFDVRMLVEKWIYQVTGLKII